MSEGPYDLIIYNAMILTQPSEDRLLKRGGIFIREGLIDRLWEGGLENFRGELKAEEMIDAEDGLMIPGLINTHNHAAMSLFRGLADDLPLMEWLHEHIFPAEARYVNEEFVFWGTLLACAEMIRSGTTSFADGYFHEDAAVEAVRQSGMRGVLAEGVVDLPTPDVSDPSMNVKNADSFVSRCKGEKRITPGIFCHSAYTCSPETLCRSKEICRKYQVPFFIHAAETRTEVEEIKGRYNVSPVRHLHRLGLLDEDTILVHCIWVDEEEVGLISEAGSKVSITTESEMKLGSGVVPLVKFLSKGVKLGLGTDSIASNNNLDMFHEMDITAKLHKLNSMDPTLADARTILRMTTTDGAAVLGLSRVGIIEEGYLADIILLDTHSPHLVPLYNPSSQIVYAARGADVVTSIIDGKVVMKDRKLLTIDEELLFKKINCISKKIKRGHLKD